MQYIFKLLIFCTLKSVNSNSIENPMNSKEVNNLISRIIQADKFDELVDKIAERAVVKLKDAQRLETSSNDSMYRRPFSEHYSKENLKERPNSLNKHTHGKIDTKAVLEKKGYPLDNLKLRYRNLKSKHFTESKSKENLSSVSLENKDYSRTAQNIKSDFDPNIKTRNDQSLENSFDNTESREQLDNPSRKDIHWEQSNSQHDRTEDKTDVSAESKTEDISGDFHSESHSRENTDTENNRGEGDRKMVFVESPDYKEYHEQVARIKDSMH